MVLKERTKKARQQAAVSESQRRGKGTRMDRVTNTGICGETLRRGVLLDFHYFHTIMADTLGKSNRFKNWKNRDIVL